MFEVADGTFQGHLWTLWSSETTRFDRLRDASNDVWNDRKREG